MMREKLMAVLTLICLFVCATMSQSLTVDGTKLERIFDGNITDEIFNLFIPFPIFLRSLNLYTCALVDQQDIFSI
jgi:hypothetical protein